ncbi:methyltransferase family protein [Erythrobacter sp. EC-HK427]|uniref:methyltransferase family protein n=1 Tax=Erythrobacter sp. EC-HK427 TaxID=2038396 RepID=UPI0012551C52|nr:isoprenylcysteine carboxylmethyltransferase family protein [Erythrobacter sp. EC-HK427]VVT15102.1 Isoprenylcysteine carboxyl methyltransferase [Erythrobacter sp. EC-HK427]
MNNRIPPPVIGLLTAFLMWFAANSVPQAAFSVPGQMVLAAVLAAAGLAIELVAVAAFIRARTTVNPLVPERASELVTDGLYRISRNPMYLGMALLLAGWGMWLGNGASLLGIAVFVLYITRFQIMPEEAALAARFGPQFAAYRAKVRRWI